MPELNIVHLVLLALLLLAGVLLGWVLRSDRCTREKLAINAGWQEQLEGEQAENRHLTQQNRKLTQRIGEVQASHKESRQRASELTEALSEAVETGGELQKDLRETALERDGLQAQLEERDARAEATARVLGDKDRKIFKLSGELSSWQARLPPLIARFRERDREAKELSAELERYRRRLAELEERLAANETRVEPADASGLGTALHASNEGYETTMTDVPGGHRTAPQRNGNDYLPEAAAAAPVAGYGARDDLKRIKGVGPAIERTLNELGFLRFEQLASISEHDIDRLARRLKGLRNRIYREDWIGQARALRDG